MYFIAIFFSAVCVLEEQKSIKSVLCPKVEPAAILKQA